MKFVLIALSLLATAGLFWFCKHPRYTADQLPEKQIRFGTGGGFVGRETLFSVLENGQMFKKGPDGLTSALPDIKSRKAKSLFKSLAKSDFANLSFQHPSNVYSFVEIPVGRDGYHRVTWGDPAHPVDARVQDLFDQLNALVPQPAPQK
jgi:hypothetical protein